MAELIEVKECYAMTFRIHRSLNLENMDPEVHEFVEDKFISILVVNFESSSLTMENFQSLALSVPSFYWRLTGEQLDPSLLRIAPARLEVVHHGAETGIQHGNGESPAEENAHYGQGLPSPSSAREASPAAPASTTEDANGLLEAHPLAWGEDEPLSVASEVEPEHGESSSSTFWIPAGPNSTWQQVEIEGQTFLRKLDELSLPQGFWSITDYADDHTMVMSVHVCVRVRSSLRTWNVRREERPPHRPAGTSQRKRKAKPDDNSGSSSPPPRKRPMRL
ncbi:uncharacterized protein LOC125722858 [Brienomyrus brachyistius]|uniref:uncharacterized protein LOC125722858 n=1 Tax=Brienomyrus brachyistius TaxID=42636 RepID=UPI0020B42CF2|nr:uncharacterized protein LOC125722858 [Brienomyrus brachyistius]